MSLLPGMRTIDSSLRPPSTPAEFFFILLKTSPPTHKKSYPIFLRVRSPCKISEHYDNPFWGFSNGEEEKLP